MEVTVPAVVTLQMVKQHLVRPPTFCPVFCGRVVLQHGVSIHRNSEDSRRQALQSTPNEVQAEQSEEKEELPDFLDPLVAAEQLLQGCRCMVDRYVGAKLTPGAWKQLVENEEEAELRVRYVHGRADPSTRKVIERLLRVKQCDRDKEIRVADTWSMWTDGFITVLFGFV